MDNHVCEELLCTQRFKVRGGLKAAGKKTVKNAAQYGVKIAKEVGKDFVNVDAAADLALQSIPVNIVHSVADHARRKTLAGATALKEKAIDEGVSVNITHSVAGHAKRKTLAGATILGEATTSKLNRLTHHQAAGVHGCDAEKKKKQKLSGRSLLDCKMEIQVMVSGCLARFGDDVNVVSILCDLLKLMQDICKESGVHLSILTLLDITASMIRQLNLPGTLRLRLRTLISELLYIRY